MNVHEALKLYEGTYSYVPHKLSVSSFFKNLINMIET